jgi:hypothetical protein
LPEYAITNGGPQPLAQGRLTWDPTHVDGEADALHSVALVRFQLQPGLCRWSVGTSPFIECVPGPYRAIEKLQIVAGVRRVNAHRIVQWESAEITLHYADGRREEIPLAALPRAASGRATRRSVYVQEPAQGAGTGDNTMLHQYAEVSAISDAVVGVTVTGQVLLRANDSLAGAAVLQPDDLQGRVVVFAQRTPGDGFATQA